MDNPAEKFLSRVQGVKKTGPDRWIFRVPTRKDKHPSGSARLMPDGRLLIHDFAGSTAQEILEAVGLEFSDLYPASFDRGMTATRGESRPFYAADALRCLHQETLFVWACALTIKRGATLADTDYKRLDKSIEHIQNALTAAGL